MTDWIEWNGGECPVKNGTLVDVRYRSGLENMHVAAGMPNCYTGSITTKSAYYWFNSDSPGDIIAYRLHKPEHAEAPVENKYHRNIKGVAVDVYDVLVAFNVTCPARAHAIKKLLAAGQRGHKDEAKDLQEAMQAIARSIELLK